MKIMLTSAVLASCLTLTGTVLAQASLKEDPAYLNIDGALDLKVIKPAVNVNVPKFLLNSVLSEFDGGKGDPIASLGINLKELTQEVKLIRVVVFEGVEEHEEAIEKGLAKLKAELEDGWLAIVSVPEDNVFVYAKSDASGEKLAGLALLVADGGDVVIGNLVGNVPIGKIAKVAAKMSGDMVPAELLQEIGGLAAGVGHDHAHAEEGGHGEADGEAHDEEHAAEDTAVGSSSDRF